MLYCAQCTLKGCSRPVSEGDAVSYPPNCPTLKISEEELRNTYRADAEEFRVAKTSAGISPDHTENRLQKTMRFAKLCGYEHLGLAFCASLEKEAAAIAKVLIQNGFTVDSVCCKVGRGDRTQFDVPPARKPMCNPLYQAKLLNEAGTQLNIVLGLCVGHDSLFIRHSDAIVTVLACKDHVYCNAPIRCVEEM